jgi:hypothetical protein
MVERCWLVPLYYFNIRDSDYFEDDEGIHLPDDRTARAHAIGIIHELHTADETTWRGFTMEVKREGRLIWEIPFDESRPAAES